MALRGLVGVNDRVPGPQRSAIDDLKGLVADTGVHEEPASDRRATAFVSVCQGEFVKIKNIISRTDIKYDNSGNIVSPTPTTWFGATKLTAQD